MKGWDFGKRVVSGENGDVARRWVGGWVGAVAGLVLAATAHAGSASLAGSELVQIKVLSNRADLISGGDALIELDVPKGVEASKLSINLNGQDVSAQFARRANGLVEGVLTGMPVGTNVLTAMLPDGHGAKISLNNHPNGGPVIAGPQVQPWRCAAGALDAQCNQPATYRFIYKSSITHDFADYDPANPAKDVAKTTTDQGVTVPYIVRIENGHQDRGAYRISVLYNPENPWSPWAPQRGWNGKVLFPGGSSCGAQHGEGSPPGLFVQDPISRGFAVLTTSLLDNGQNCNMAVQAEALMMLKEHFIETYGPMTYTIGTGCSGGSIYQQQNANAYPGIFDGIIPMCSFPDTFTTALEVEDCALLTEYWMHPENWGQGVFWTHRQEIAVTGHPRLTTCQSWDRSKFAGLLNPRLESGAQHCSVSAELVWTPENPTGVRCDLLDYMISIFGPDDVEGYARNPIANVGIQYGLGALLSGAISVPEFVDLNVKIGSHDINYNYQQMRKAADPVALNIVYRGSFINEASQLASIPMIDLRGHDAWDIHLDYHSFEVRARLDKANGNHNNQVIWMSPVPLAGDVAWQRSSVSVMDQWLANIHADQRDVPQAQKVAEDKPALAVDRCFAADGRYLGDLTTCRGQIEDYSLNPRRVAGMPLTNDIFQCQLKPLDPADYGAIRFTPAQWAQLQQVFPNGVCDYSLPGVGQQANLPWMDYSAGPGGQPLGAAPVSVAF